MRDGILNRWFLLIVLLGGLAAFSMVPVSEATCDLKCRNWTIYMTSSKTSGIYCMRYKLVDCYTCDGNSPCLTTRSGGAGSCGTEGPGNQFKQEIPASNCSNNCTLGTPPPDRYADADYIDDPGDDGFYSINRKQLLCISN